MNFIRSLKHRNFRLYFVGQVFSLTGIWMQNVAVGWLVWKLTRSPEWLGAVGFASQIPVLFFGLFAGVIADRVNRYRLVVSIQVIAMLQAVILSVLTLTGIINPVSIFILAIFLGVVVAFDMPSRLSFMVDMVGHENIGNAIAVNSSVIHGARTLGPIVAGLIIARFGEGICFAINASSFLFVLAALLFMRRGEFYPQVVAGDDSVKNLIKGALRHVWNSKEMRPPVIFVGVLSLALMPYAVFLPQIVSERFSGTARELGIAMGAAGVGALAGAVMLALRKGIGGLERGVKICLGLGGVVLVALSLCQNFVAALPILASLGFLNFIVVAGCNTILQTVSPHHLRGRVMSVFSVAFLGLAPIGSLVAGFVASHIGIGWTLAAGGAICILVSVSQRRKPVL